MRIWEKLASLARHGLRASHFGLRNTPACSAMSAEWGSQVTAVLAHDALRIKACGCRRDAWVLQTEMRASYCRAPGSKATANTRVNSRIKTTSVDLCRIACLPGPLVLWAFALLSLGHRGWRGSYTYEQEPPGSTAWTFSHPHPTQEKCRFRFLHKADETKMQRWANQPIFFSFPPCHLKRAVWGLLTIASWCEKNEALKEASAPGWDMCREGSGQHPWPRRVQLQRWLPGRLASPPPTHAPEAPL